MMGEREETKMKLERVTITGLDRKTDVFRLMAMAPAFHPLVEFAVLASPSRAGKEPRYPTIEEIKTWLSYVRKFKVAVHICGRYSRKPNEFFEAIGPDHSCFLDRIQWNVAPSHLKLKDITEMAMRASEGHHTVIVQIRDEESEILLKTLQDNHVTAQPLFDASGGRGLPFENVRTPLSSPATGRWTGYAGGISPETVSGVLERLEAELPKDQPVWIDMETGVRTDDWLDLDKVQEVLCRCYTFTQEQKRP